MQMKEVSETLSNVLTLRIIIIMFLALRECNITYFILSSFLLDPFFTQYHIFWTLDHLNFLIILSLRFTLIENVRGENRNLCAAITSQQRSLPQVTASCAAWLYKDITQVITEGYFKTTKFPDDTQTIPHCPTLYRAYYRGYYCSTVVLYFNITVGSC